MILKSMERIPKEYAKQFNSFDEFKEYMMDKAKRELMSAFDKSNKK